VREDLPAALAVGLVLADDAPKDLQGWLTQAIASALPPTSHDFDIQGRPNS